MIRVPEKVHGLVFFFLWPRGEHFTWDRSLWRDRNNLVEAITSAEPDKWAKTDYSTRSIVTYQQVLLVMMPDRVLSIDVRDTGDLVLSNQPRPRHVAFAYIMIGFLILFELVGIILTIQQMTAHEIMWSEVVRGLALLAIAPPFIYGAASLSGRLGYQSSRTLFIRLAHELVALPGIIYRGPVEERRSVA